MSTTIGDLIFDNNKTLFEVLDALDVPRVSGQLDTAFERLDEVNDQLRQLGSIVDANQASNAATFIAINTQINGINTDLTSVKTDVTALKTNLINIQDVVTDLNTSTGDLLTEFDLLELKFGELETKVNGFAGRITAVEVATNSLAQQVNGFSTRLTTVESNSTSVSGRVTVLEANKSRQQRLTLGNEYIFTYRVGNPGNTYFYRITYSGSNSVINALQGYSATVLSSQDNTTTTRTVYLAAPFDAFSANGRYNYPMIQGPCLLSFTVNNTSPTLGYITVL